MPYLPPETIASTLRRVQAGALILPAIQREFVWKPGQVTALFDSVMRGYPIGGFLSWAVEPQTAGAFRFYAFLKDYNEFNHRHNPELDVPSAAVTAVLDGQQRLTSLNIGLRGTYAWKKKYGWSQFVENFPPRTLHLNLQGPAAPNAAGLMYDFRFLTEEQLRAMSDEEATYWLPVPKVYDATKINNLVIELSQRAIGNDPTAMEMATDLWEKVHSEQSVHFYQEVDQDVERVLDIFIRVNSGGTVLSYSDLLLSIATAQWKNRDARKEIHGLVDDLNATGAGFRLSKDLVLKSGLVLSGIKDIGFQVKNFTAENMALMDSAWDGISAALRVAVGVLSDFGLSGATLTANSVVIPLALYIHQRGLTQAYRETAAEAEDRERIKRWVLRSLIVPGIWGAGLDQLLNALRNVIQDHGQHSFPLAQLEQAMAARSKSLTATPELIDSLLDLEYKDTATFAVLAILFPHVNTRHNHHVDHIFPDARLRDKDLKDTGLDPEAHQRIKDTQNRIGNLQLLEGGENVAKSAKMPAAWAAETFKEAHAMTSYLERNALGTLPASPTEFLGFYEQRRDALRDLLASTLGSSQPEPLRPTEQGLPPINEAIESDSNAPL